MADSELAQLRAQLRQEKAAREEHEHALTAKTRQLWQLRDKHEKEVRQLSDQLSVVRASLILAHKAQLAHKTSRAAPAKNLQVVITQDTDIPGVDVAADSPKKRKQIADQVHRDGKDAHPVPSPKAPTAANAAEAGSKLQLAEVGTAVTADAAVGIESNLPCDGQALTLQQEKTAAGSLGSDSTIISSNSCSRSQVDAASASAVLLAATAKLQQLVEQLTQQDPAVAADLSLLQWQLTTAYGSLTGATGRSGSAVETALTASAGLACGATASSSDASSSSGNDCDDQQQAAADSTCIESSSENHHHHHQQQPVTPGAVKPQPTDVHPLKATDSISDHAPPTPTAAAAATAGQQHSEADVAAAARLFSGAASTQQAPQLDWYYIEHGSSIRGPHDAALMIRWHCNWFLEDNLPVAGVLQHADGSSTAPPTAAFQPLRQLLELVQQGGKYAPCASAAVQQHGPASCDSSDSQLPSLPVSTHSSCWNGHQQTAEHVATAQLDASPMMQEEAAAAAAEAGMSADISDCNSGDSTVDVLAVSIKQQEKEQEAKQDAVSSQGWSIKAVQDALDSVGNAVEEMVISGLAGTVSSSPTGEGEGNGSALDFVSDFPQLFPAAVMSDVVQQRHSAGGAPGQLQHPAAAVSGKEGHATAAAAAASSGKVAGEKQGSQEEGAVAMPAWQPPLAGVWRVESLWREDTTPKTAAK